MTLQKKENKEIEIIRNIFLNSFLLKRLMKSLDQQFRRQGLPA